MTPICWFLAGAASTLVLEAIVLALAAAYWYRHYYNVPVIWSRRQEP